MEILGGKYCACLSRRRRQTRLVPFTCKRFASYLRDVKIFIAFWVADVVNTSWSCAGRKQHGGETSVLTMWTPDALKFSYLS
ncbi:hypothetical protein RRG08_050334 [Elysia crispata]|uniref:Uncharacterized protein n=1 Tax=Elysia crispata TaxID=231223 RepID=A0AAE1DP49_9GAST|nr:hypothetical protein RRG08_050334 [Elysia crispata]